MLCAFIPLLLLSALESDSAASSRIAHEQRLEMALEKSEEARQQLLHTNTPARLAAARGAVKELLDASYDATAAAQQIWSNDVDGLLALTQAAADEAVHTQSVVNSCGAAGCSDPLASKCPPCSGEAQECAWACCNLQCGGGKWCYFLCAYGYVIHKTVYNEGDPEPSPTFAHFLQTSPLDHEARIPALSDGAVLPLSRASDGRFKVEVGFYDFLTGDFVEALPATVSFSAKPADSVRAAGSLTGAWASLGTASYDSQRALFYITLPDSMTKSRIMVRAEVTRGANRVQTFAIIDPLNR